MLKLGLLKVTRQIANISNKIIVFISPKANGVLCHRVGILWIQCRLKIVLILLGPNSNIPKIMFRHGQ